MKTLTCDVCKHSIKEPVVGRNYFYLADRDLCESCKEALEMALRPVIRTKQPFTYEWFDRLTQDSIEKAIEKGKFDL
jgi:hypothetical protein